MTVYSQVEQQFSKAGSYADKAGSLASQFVTALTSTVSGLHVPELDFDLTWPTAPSPAALVSIGVADPATNFPAYDAGAAPTAPSPNIDTSGLPEAPALQAFTYAPGTAPDKPAPPDALGVYALPTDPGEWTPPTMPTMLDIVVRPFGGVNTHEAWVDKLSDMPADLVLAVPTAYQRPNIDPYSSALLEAVKTALRGRLQGGTGLAATVEQGLWDRARDREALAVAANVSEVVRNAEARGFSLPPGAMHAQMREAQRMGLGKTLEASREIAFKQADLEQTNARHAIEQSIGLEGKLVEYTNSIEQRAFEAARYLAENAVEIYNSQVTAFRALLEKYSTYATIYRSLIEGEKAKVDVYRAEVDAERTKVEVNQAQLGLVRSQVEVRGAVIELYKNRLAAVQTLIDVDKLKIEAFGERIKAYVAEISGESVRAEVFKTQIGSNQVLSDVFKTNVEAYAARVGASSSAAKATAEVYDAKVRGYASQIQGYAARVSAESERVRAVVSTEGLKLDGVKTQVLQNTSNNQLQVENYKALIGLYDANKTLALQKAKIVSDNYFALRNLVADASKVAAQVNAQLAASAYHTIQAHASIAGTDSTQVGFNYSGDTSDSRAAPTF